MNPTETRGLHSHPELEADPSGTDYLTADHMQWVKRIAYRLGKGLPPHLDTEDLFQSGVLGLLQAARTYRPSKNSSFRGYAGKRVRGAMLDEIRKASCNSRGVFEHEQDIIQATKSVENDKGGDASPQEIASHLGLSHAAYHAILARIQSNTPLYLGEPAKEWAFLASKKDQPDELVGRAQVSGCLREAISELPARLQIILELHYDDGLTQREIGSALGICESRVCQLRKKAVHLIRKRLLAPPRCEEPVPAGKHDMDSLARQRLSEHLLPHLPY